MSEYQYYEWQAIDQPLTEKQKAEVDRLSSHMDVVTSTQAIVTYSWGDFKYDPEEILLKYFDAFLYMANWGSRHLMFRLPKEGPDIQQIRQYCMEDAISLNDAGAYWILSIELNEEEGSGWVEGEGTLSRLLPLREQIIEGDYRGLYLLWLKAIDLGLDQKNWVDEEEEEDSEEEYGEPKHIAVDEDNLEPPVPAGLKDLLPEHKKLIDFFEIDPYLVQAAISTSPTQKSEAEIHLAALLPLLSREECEQYLVRLLNGEPRLSQNLRKRLHTLAHQQQGLKRPDALPPQRSIYDLKEEAKKIQEGEEHRMQAEAARKRLERLNELAQREEATWVNVISLIEQKNAHAYDEAIHLLVQLRELASYRGSLADFAQRFQTILERYRNRPALINRFQKNALV